MRKYIAVRNIVSTVHFNYCKIKEGSKHKWIAIYFVLLKPLYLNLISISSFALYKILYFFDRYDNVIRKCQIGIDARILTNNISGLERYIYQLIVHLSKVDKKRFYNIFVYRPAFDKNLSKNFEEVTEEDITKYIISQNKKFACGEIKLFHVTWQDMYLWHNLPLLWSSRSVITVHDLINLLWPEYHNSFNRLKYKFLLKCAVKWADRIITVSEYTKREIIKHLNADENKIRVISLACDLKFKPIIRKGIIDKIKSKYNIDGKYILSVGKSYTHKNIPHLIRAFGKLVSNENLDYKLVLVGEKYWGPANLEIKNIIEELNLDDKVMWLGHIDDSDMPALYSGSDLFVLPSLYEGFGLPILEAMSCGTPVIASNTASIPEIVGDAGILLNPHDVEGLTQNMKTILKNEKERDRLIQKGLERSRTFNWNKCANETLEVYRELLNS